MLLTQIKNDRLSAMKDGNEKKYEFLTTLFSEIQRMDKEKQEKDDMVQKVIMKSVKSLKEMIEATGIGDISAFNAEIAVLSEYLPKQLDDEGLENVIKQLAQEEGASCPGDMGKIMKRLSSDYKGQYDGKSASQLVREILA